MDDEHLFEIATKEFASGNTNSALLAKARTLAEGNQNQTEFKYIELRVQQIKTEKRRRYINATTDAGRIIAPALGGFARDLVKNTVLAIIILGSLVGLLSVMGINI